MKQTLAAYMQRQSPDVVGESDVWTLLRENESARWPRDR